MNQLSVQQYADKYGRLIDKTSGNDDGRLTISRQAILYRIKNDIALPYVSEIKKVGKAYVLTIDENKNTP